MILFICIAIYVIGGVLSYGSTFGFFSREYFSVGRHPFNDYQIAMMSAMMGPVGLVIDYLDNGFKHGLKYRPIREDHILVLTQEQRTLLISANTGFELSPLAIEWLGEAGIAAYCGLRARNGDGFHNGFDQCIAFNGAKDAITFKLRFF